MRKEINDVIKWFKRNGKVICIGFLIEMLITITIAAIVTWNKTYGNNKSMVSFQMPLLLISGFITFCAIDSMSFLGSMSERQIMRSVLSSNPFYFIKRYLILGVFFGIINTILSTILFANSLASLDWKMFISIPMLTIYSSLLFAVTSMIPLQTNKGWIFQLSMLVMLSQGIASGISLYPFFFSEMSALPKVGLGVVFPIFGCATIINSLNEAFNYLYIIPFIFMLISTISTTTLFKQKIQWKTKPLFATK